MIKNYPFLKKLVPLFFLLFSVAAFSQSIQVTNVTPVCFGNPVTITFSATSGNGNGVSYDNNTSYAIYISNDNGSSYTYIPNSIFNTTGSGVNYCGNNCTTTGITRSITIPSNYLPGSGYKIAIGSSSPNFSWTSGASSSFVINALPSTPTITPGGPITFCTGGSVTLTSSVGTSYLWSTGATTASINVTTSGSYTVQVKNASGCQSPASTATDVTVNALPAAPTITAGGPFTFCSGGSVTLTSSAGSSYLWSTGATTASINVTTSGSYTVQVKNASGCQSPASTATAVTVNALPTAPTVGTITQPTCSIATGSVILNGLPSGTWTINPGAISGTGTSTTISGLAVGTFNYTVTNANGCTSTASSNVDINSQPAINTWNGSVSTDWNTDDNWCYGVPSYTNDKDVLIPTIPTGGRFPILSKYTVVPMYPQGYVKNIVFESGTTLIIENNALNVAGILTLNGKIDLNGESQLVQNTGSTFDAASTGTIEIDQQGTGDSFNYNYWSSPVNSNIAAKTYSIGGVLKDGTNPVYKEITFGAPYTFADGTAPLVGEAIKLSTYWMFKLENSKGYAAWTRIGKDISIKVGVGYTMKGSNTSLPEQNYTFVGKPNNGDITLPIAIANDYLVGNPYPSAIDAWKFIDQNLAHTGPLYFWEHTGGGTHNLAGYQGGYATYTKSGGVSAATGPKVVGVGTSLNANKVPGRYIPVGQAFFVVGEIAGQIEFNNSQRFFKKESEGNSIFMKSSNAKSKTENTLDDDLRPKFRIGFDAPKISHRQLLLTIDEKATPTFDRGYEAEIYEIFADDFYWMLDGKKYIIQGTNAVGLNSSEVPIGIQLSKTGMVTVKIDALENVDDDTSIYLKDKVTGESFNMRKKQVQLNLVAGKYADRFVLIFKTQKLMAEDVKAEVLIPAAAQPIIEGIHVFMNNASGELQIKNNSTEEITSVALVNTLGQTIKSWNSNFNIRTISLPLSIATGVYLVQINTKTGKTVKKISVE